MGDSVSQIDRLGIFTSGGKDLGNAKATVYLVGAGPGRPDLITLRGVECLRQADAVVLDALVDRRVSQPRGYGFAEQAVSRARKYRF